ncbi:UMP kinase [Thermogladius sp. 4427co]|uniref:UMP kinase n=1 Tax=Thermogladius sp. 4427co TaxID=3450718 RepID=UPI003F79D06C
MRKIIVVKITGKAFDEPDILAKFVNTVREIARENKVVVVAGGGRVARDSISLAVKLGVSSNYWLDEIGIGASRLNALVLAAALQPLSYPGVPTSIRGVLEAVNASSIVVLGGLIPGQSTASVMLEVAEALGVSEVYDLSVADYIYDKDPRTSPDAKPLKIIRVSELAGMLKASQIPGDYALIDLRALDIASRSGIIIKIASYKDPGNLLEMIRGGNPGSMIIPG